ncbi:hypothetical protein T484DRAFT_2134871 [Baffinella frigidus]|nr:hypothetical protein T484DRAFT_2134871 [Cryptophyta sp. CCMP2293]
MRVSGFGTHNPGVRRIDRPRPTSPLAPEEIGAIGLRPEAGPSIEAERMRVPTWIGGWGLGTRGLHPKPETRSPRGLM